MIDLRIVALAGGVGGAKLADGLAQVLQPDQLTVIVNTGDDFSFLGLRISPDLDTVCYTLAGLANPETGWGRGNETWQVLDALCKMQMPNWFKIGDSDLATHLARTVHLAEGWKLSEVTHEFCRIWGLSVDVLPMSDDVVQTWVYTDEGDLQFQEYFVHRQCKPVVRGFRFEGVEKSQPAPGVLEALDNCDLVILCPSNPWVSIDPILAVPGILKSVKMHTVVAISPIIGQSTVKGPAAKMFSELGIQPSAFAVAQHYQHVIESIVIDNSDFDLLTDINKLGIQTFLTNILMRDRRDRGRLAKEIIDDINGKGRAD
jgi:LPPG:FO 2-phospho-L-lactate transferase